MADISRSIIDTLIAEAGGEGEESMRRVAETILNRAAVRGLTPEQVVAQPYQYTGYSNPGPLARQAQQNEAVRAIAEQAYRTALEPGDPTGGADHYYAPGSISQPSWARSMTPTGSYGGHNYYASRPIPPGEIPNAVGTALSVVPTPRVSPNPVTMSPDISLMRNPLMSSSARSAQVRQPQQYASDLALSGNPNVVTPFFTPNGAASRMPTDFVATTTARGLGSLTPDALPPPYPQSMSPQIASLRARDQNLQMALNQKYPPTPLPPLPPSGQNNTAALNSAARRAALLANQSAIERNAPRIPQSYAGQERSPNIRNARLTTPAIVQPTNVALNQAPIRVVAPARQAPFPVTASAGLQASRLAPRTLAPAPLMPSASVQAARIAPVQQVAQNSSSVPLRIVVNGAGSYGGQPMTPVQSLQSQGLSPSDAYALANQRAAEAARERAGLSSSSGSDWFRSVTGG